MDMHHIVVLLADQLKYVRKDVELFHSLGPYGLGFMTNKINLRTKGRNVGNGIGILQRFHISHIDSKVFRAVSNQTLNQNIDAIVINVVYINFENA